VRIVLFHRNYRKFKGGQLKVWDYFNHVLASPEFTPRIEFSPRTIWDQANPWRDAGEYIVESARSVRPDVFFVAGGDWVMLDRHPDAGADIPVVNLVQQVRHADPNNNRFQFLSRKAIRICVSEEVTQALLAKLDFRSCVALVLESENFFERPRETLKSIWTSSVCLSGNPQPQSSPRSARTKAATKRRLLAGEQAPVLSERVGSHHTPRLVVPLFRANVEGVGSTDRRS
jgi:hypothetical protein